MFYKFIKLIVATKIYLWIKPRIKSLAFFIFFVLLIIYSHSEYINWAEKSNNVEFLGYSFIIKNIFIFFSVIIFIFYLKRKGINETSSSVNDGFEKYRKKEKLKTKLDNLIDKK